MEKTFGDVLKLIFPMSAAKRKDLRAVSQFLGKEDAREFRHWLKMGKVSVNYRKMGSKKLDAEEDYPEISAEIDEPELNNLVEKWNSGIMGQIRAQLYSRFSLHAGTTIQNLIAPNIVGMETVKEAALLQLFANEKVHVLLLGDPGTGKTDILRAAANLAPISSFGLGSGTSGAGLTVTVKGDQVIKGVIPMAHRGLCCIDELNLMKERDRAGLLNAMEKGFISYDKGNKHIQLDADVKVLATANPKGDQFAGWIVDTLKKQLPFDSALLSRFHLVFLIRRPDTEEFVEISKHIIRGEKDELTEEEVDFVKGYLEYVGGMKVKFDKKLEKKITNFVEEIKEDEDKYLIDVSPRLVVGIMRLAKASARIGMREKVTEGDLENVLFLVRESLKIPRREEKN